MLSDSSSSEENYNPVGRRRYKRQQVTTSESSDDDIPVKRPVRSSHSRLVLSSSSSSSSDGPRIKRVRKAVLDSETSESSDSYESDGPVLPHRKELRKRGVLQSDSESYSSEIEAALGRTAAPKNAKSDGSSSDSDGGEQCIICFKTLQYPMARPSACTHTFHEQCLSTWSKTSNTCPIDRVKYNSIDIVTADNKVLNSKIVTTPTPCNTSDVEPDNPTFCEVCHFHDREEVMLLCDRCDAGYHIDCLDPPLDYVPTGQWFCPSCQLTSIEDSEVLELLADNVLLESRLRSRPQRPARGNPRLHLSRRAVQAAFNLATSASSQASAAHANDEPSTSTGRRSSSFKRTRKTRKHASQRRRTTKYKVELVTTEDGTTVEVKLAIQSRRHRKKRQKSSKRSKRSGGGRCNDDAGGSSHGPHSSFHPAPLDLFGSRPTLDYFSGCEAEDEEDLGGGGVGVLRGGQSALASRSGLVSRKGIARILASSTPAPRPRPNIQAAPASSVNILDDILKDQQLWHHPGPANISSTSDGAVRVSLPGSSSEVNTRESAIHGGRGEGRGGGRYNAGRYNGGRGRYGGNRYSGARSSPRGATPGRNTSVSASSTSSSLGGRSGDNYHQASCSFPIQPIPAPPMPPLVPPPEPPMRLCEDDVDIYGDIEPPTSMAKLVPPPEPPAMLLALDNAVVEEGASSPDEGLVIDDQRDTYDPDQPNSPSSGNRTDDDEVEGRDERQLELPDIPLPAQSIRLEDIKLPSPSKNDDDSDSEVPITEHYSKASLKIARRSSDKSESSEEDGQYIDDIIERFKKAPPLKDSPSSSDKKAGYRAKDDSQNPVKEKLERLRKERHGSCSDDESVNDKTDGKPEASFNDDADVGNSMLQPGDETPVRDEKNESADEDSRLEPLSDFSLVKDADSANRPPTPPEIEERFGAVIDDSQEVVKNNCADSVNRTDEKKLKSVEEALEEMEGTNQESDNESHENNDTDPPSSDVIRKSLEELSQSGGEACAADSPEKLKPKPQRKRNISNIESADIDDAGEMDYDSNDNCSELPRSDVGLEPEENETVKCAEWSSACGDQNDDYWSQDDRKSTDGDLTSKDIHNGHKSLSCSPVKSLSSGEVESDITDSEGGSDHSLNSSKRRRKNKMSEDEDDDDGEVDLPGRKSPVSRGDRGDEGDKDGLVEITDEEISSYEKNWEMEENEKMMKQSGLEGLETEAISECEDGLCEDATPVAQVKSNTETYLSKEEGEIITDDRNEFIPWKRVTKSTKDRSYREKDKAKDKENKDKTPEKKKKDKKLKEKRKDLERYDIRKVIGDKRKKDEFGRDIASSQSRSRSVSRETAVMRSEVRRVREWSKTRKRSRARSLSRSRNRDGSTGRTKRRRSRSRGRSLDRARTKSNYGRDKETKRSRATSKTRRDKSRETKKSQTSKAAEKKKSRDKSAERRDRSNVKDKTRDERDKRAASSSSCSTCSCSSCERERLATNKLTVSVPSAPSPPPKKSKDKKKDKSRKTGKKDSNKRRRTESPLPSKEVFTSGDNILVSVNFKSSSKTSGEPRRGGSRRVWEEESRKKKDKENQPVRSVVPILAATQEKDKRRQRRRMASNAKPVAIIDLDPSPFREEAVSPQEVIVLTDESDHEGGSNQKDAGHQNLSTGPKTPPEPPVKFTISSKPQLRSLSNPLEEADEEGDRDDDDGGESMVMHKGPNTPPEPPETYDPFEPTKSRSPTPRRDNIRGPSSTDNQIVNNSEVHNDGKQQPSPQPKVQETVVLDKPSYLMEADLDFCLGGDSPYSPGSSEADDLFDPPPLTPTRTKPIHPLGKLPLPPTPLLPLNKPKLTPSPTKRRQPQTNRLTPIPRKAPSSKKEIGIRLDENQLKILDELPSSAVEMQVKDKFLKKLNRQERVVEEVKFVLKPHYNKKHVTKEEYKDILRKAVPKICHSKSGEINPFKIQKLIEAYVKKYRHKRKKNGPAPPTALVKPKPTKVLPPILKSMFGNLGMRSQETLNNRNTTMNKTM